MSDGKKIPITRINKFFGFEDYRLEIEMGREALEGDGNFTVILFRVDRQNTASDDLYNEAMKDDIRYFPPVELKVMPIIDEAENKAHNQGSGTLKYNQDGRLTFIVYDEHLKELNVDITYGDYIGYSITETQMRYYAVVNDGRKNFDNQHTIMGYKGPYRKILCAPVDPSEFSAY